MYDLVTIDVHAMTESYFIVLNTLSCELKIYHVIVICLNHACANLDSQLKKMWFETFSASIIDGNSIGKICFPKLVHLS
jgi:hypothetical protein